MAGDSLAGYSLHTLPAAKDAVGIETVTGTAIPMWRVETLRDSKPTGSIELRALTARPVHAGDVALLHLSARATRVTDETGIARIAVVAGAADGTGFNSYDGDFSITREWQDVWVPWRFRRDYAAGKAAVMLRFGFKAQTVEIRGVGTRWYGSSVDIGKLPCTRYTYEGREAGAAWRTRAGERIEVLRKRDFKVCVLDRNGAPVAGASVRVREVDPAFQWGCALQLKRLVSDSPDNRRYQDYVLKWFNEGSATNDLKWPAWAGEWGRDFSQRQTLDALRWLRDHGLHVRGHVFVWPGWGNLPEAIRRLRGTEREREIPDLVLAHIRDEAAATRGLIAEWDVLNEPYTNHDLMDAFGRELMPEWYREARAATGSGVGLYFNDFDNHDTTSAPSHLADFLETTHYLLANGAPVDGLGLQAHMGGRPSAPEDILGVLDRYRAEFGLPIRFTEFDQTTSDEALQADFLRDFLIASYSHPSVVGVQLWGFWEKVHWRPVAALVREDWSEKPSAAVWSDLVLHRWRTDASGTADSDGVFSGRGYEGTYMVRVEQGGRSREVPMQLDPPAGLAKGLLKDAATPESADEAAAFLREHPLPATVVTVVLP